MSVQFYQEILLWLNTNSHINLSVDQIFLQNYPPPAISDDLRRQLDLFISLTKGTYMHIVVKLMRKILIFYNL